MPHVQRVLKIAILALTIAVPDLAFAAPDIAGVWMNDTGRGAIEIKPCGEQICGHVVWVKDAEDTKGCGRQIIGNAAEVKPGLWDNGWIYSPEKKARYDVELKPLNDGTLRVTGYAGTKLLSRTMIWTRAPKDLQRCGTQEASKQPETKSAAVIEPSKPVTQPTAPVVAAKPEIKAEPQQSAEITPPPVKTEPPVVAQETTPVPPPASKTEAKPEPQTEPKTEAAIPEKTPKPMKKAEAQPKEYNEDADEPAPSSGRVLKKLNLDKVFKRTASGDCKLDLPWVKVRFKCGHEE